MSDEEQLKDWQESCRRMFRVNDYQKLKVLSDSIDKQIAQLEEDIPNFKTPRNPREDSIQFHSKNKLTMLKKQKGRMETKLKELETQIAADIEAAKEEV